MIGGLKLNVLTETEVTTKNVDLPIPECEVKQILIEISSPAPTQKTGKLRSSPSAGRTLRLAP
jgi:hypothetical protein